ncbi:MAG: ABC transporter permease [Bacteroidales bacterium]|jgi:putative ABC transport system permease protein|nr:ABC transporter permease [Bacteroidales bacterium]
MKQFIRNFEKQLTVGLLNICSLSLGIMIAVIVGLWAINELSFDRFHKNRDRIYRTIMNGLLNDSLVSSPATFRPLGEHAKEELPIIEDMCRVFVINQDIKIDNVLHRDIKTLMADNNFFNFFTFPLEEGDPVQVIAAPDRVVISRSAAARYFPEEQNPVGKIIKYQDRDFIVSGIMKNMPKNSSLQTDFVFPFFGWWTEAGWGTNDSYNTFFLLQEGATTESLAESLQQIVYREFAMFKNFKVTYSLEPLSDIHFSSRFMDFIIKGNKPLVITFILTAIAILIISCINFANLFVSTSFFRAKAIGVRKTVGAKRSRLMLDFYMETACYAILSIITGLIIAVIMTPTFNNFTQSNVNIDFNSPQLYIFLAVLFIFVVLLAGSFPALYMTRFDPLETINGKFKGKKLSLLQKSLVIIQFTASITLLIVVVFMQKQVNYMITYDLGFDKEHVLYVNDRGKLSMDYRTLEGEFYAEPSITNITKSNGILSAWTQGWTIEKVPSGNTQPILMEARHVSPNYFEFFDMKIIDGENPFYLESSLETDVVINESAAQLLGYENPVGETIIVNENKRYEIKGIIRNAYTKSLHEEIYPQVYFKLSAEFDQPVTFFKINGDTQRAISFVEQKWKEQEAEYPFIYQFLDDTYIKLYTSEMNAGKVFSFAMLTAVIITVAGLFAMAYYVTQRRLREIAIRKVYGASLKDIFILLNKNFALWVGIAFAIACPVAYYGLHNWLGRFVVKTSLNAWVFVLVGIIALLITLLTTGYQTWKVAVTNPADAIKTE